MGERPGISQPGLRGPLGGFLERFRGTSGVPATAGGDLPSELAPVFAELDVIELEAATIRREAEAEAAARGERLERELARIAADARTRAERARERAFEDARLRAEAEASATMAEGARAAAAILRHGKRRLPRLVDEVAARIGGDVR